MGSPHKGHDRFQAHSTATVHRPFIVLFEQKRADEPRDGSPGAGRAASSWCSPMHMTASGNMTGTSVIK